MKKTLKITLIATMAAIALVLDYISIRSNAFKITIYALPLLLSGILFGPFIGLAAGFVEGFLAQLLTYGLSLTTPLWMIASMLWGLLGGIFYKLFRFKKDFINIILTTLITSIIVTITNTAVMIVDGIILEYSTAYVFTELGFRLLMSAISCVIYTIILVIIVPRLKEILSKN